MEPVDKPKRTGDKTKRALELIDKQGMNPHAAADAVGLSSSAIYVALKKRREAEQGICPCCHRPLDNGSIYLNPEDRLKLQDDLNMAARKAIDAIK